MPKGRLTSIILVLLSLALLAAAASRIGRINRLRTELELQSSNPLEDRQFTAGLRIPTIALFTFRSLAINYLWIRADNLKNEGQYFDALHLTRMICALQPNLASVWSYQAWNMAYNISVAMQNGPERWQWVKNGFELIRDQGLAYNPYSGELYHQLAWIFSHKIGGIADDRHRYYKERLAYEMMRLLGRDNTTNDRLRALAQAPTDWNELSKDPAIPKLLEAVRKAAPQLDTDAKVFAALLDMEFAPMDFPPQLHQVVADFARTDAFRKLHLFIRADELRNTWKLDPNQMIEINNDYGPIDYENTDRHLSLDWRSPFTHAIYWAKQGLRLSKRDKPITKLNLHRIVYHSLQDMFHYGHLQVFTVAPPPEATDRQPGQEIVETHQEPDVRVFVSQDLRMFPIAYQATLDLIDSYESEGKRVAGGVVDGSINLCRAGVVNLYLAGHVKMARKYYAELSRRQPDNADYQLRLEKFVESEFRKQIQELSPREASEYIKAMLTESYARSAIGDDENAAIRQKYAEQIHAAFNAEFTEPGDRVRILSMPQMKWLAMKNLFDDPAVDPNIKGLLLRKLQIENPQMYERVITELNEQRSQQDDTTSSP